MIDIRQKLDEIGPFVPGADDGLLVCRCEEVTKGEIRRAVHEGIFTTRKCSRTDHIHSILKDVSSDHEDT